MAPLFETARSGGWGWGTTWAFIKNDPDKAWYGSTLEKHPSVLRGKQLALVDLRMQIRDGRGLEGSLNHVVMLTEDSRMCEPFNNTGNK